MKTTINKQKWFWLWQFDKEEQWLNEMAQQGWILTEVGFCMYTFEKGEPGEYIYRLLLLKRSVMSQESRDYMSFIEETGAEKIGDISRWVYFRKKASLGGFDLFSDIDSRLKYLRRILRFNAWCMPLTFLCVYFNFSNWYEWGRTFNLWLAGGWVALGILNIWGFIRIRAKKKALQKEKLLHE